MSRFLLAGSILVAVLTARSAALDSVPSIALGRRLFTDDRFSAPQGDFATSCASCHFIDENAQGPRAGSDFLSRSWIPWRSRDPRRHTVRNTPTIFDVDLMPALHFDGEFTSLEALVADTLTGRTMGWLPDERNAAAARARLVASDAEYRQLFLERYATDVTSIEDREAVDLVARAIADYLRSLHSPRHASYDAFVDLNGLPDRLEPSEAVTAFARRVASAVDDGVRRGTLTLPARFGADALDGMRVFFDPRRGNCVTCHPPPHFTDRSYHNIGISQAEYDSVHGDGGFARLAIPATSAAVRPIPILRETPDVRTPAAADLGYWNFADVRTSSLRRAGESDDQFLDRMIATFKTPTLRNLALTSPYMHNGAYQNLHDALRELIRLSALGRDGQLRAADEAFTAVRITEADIEPLIAFLRTLNVEQTVR
jgi:cytochrome c peroxidase